MILHIEHERGSMTVNLDKFLPTTKKRFLVLFKTIKLSMHRAEFADNLADYLADRMQLTEERRKEAGRLYSDEREHLTGVAAMLRDKKHPNGVMLTDAELIALSNEEYLRKKQLKQYRNTFYRSVKDLKQLDKLATILEEERKKVR